MSENRGYNGWSNYETWNCALWLDNDQHSYHHWRSRAEEVYRESEAEQHQTRAEAAASELADELKNEIEESAPDMGASMFSDLLNSAMSEINYHEIAEHYISDVAEEINEEEAAETVDSDE